MHGSYRRALSAKYGEFIAAQSAAGVQRDFLPPFGPGPSRTFGKIFGGPMNLTVRHGEPNHVGPQAFKRIREHSRMNCFRQLPKVSP